MASSTFVYARLEPQPNDVDLQGGFASTVEDPYWLLARQWQMGELQGENASSPVFVHYDLRHAPIDCPAAPLDARLVPAEAIVESEADDWWTMGRRIRVGRLLAPPASQAGIPLDDALFADPPPPYEHFKGSVDGLALWRLMIAAGEDPSQFVAGPPVESVPAWDSRQLLYEQYDQNCFETEGALLIAERHRGDRLDWYSVDAGAIDTGIGSQTTPRRAIPAGFHYPGAPNSRWWEFENAEVDAGAYVPDQAHSATAILTELIHSHSDDWFVFPVLADAAQKIGIEHIQVRDAFDRTYSDTELDDDGEPKWIGLRPPANWTLFHVEGLDSNELLLWNVAERPLESLPIERVQIGPDEQSNLMWAVERVLDGRETGHAEAPPSANSSPPFNDGTPSGDTAKPREFTYVPARGIAPFWHPYLIEQNDSAHLFVHYRMPDLCHHQPGLMPPPRAEVLQPSAGSDYHEMAPRAIPANGIELERRWYLARDLHGNPILWIGRRRLPSLAPPARTLRFDVMEETRERAPV
jgi:hypothetical protein